MHNKVPKNEYLKGKPGKKKDAFKKDRVVYDQKSMMGYRDDSPYRQLPFIDINTPNGYIDMSYTGMPLFANGQYLPPYSGQHFMGTNIVREVPIQDEGFDLVSLPGHVDFIDKGFIPSKTTARYYPQNPEYFQKGGEERPKVYSDYNTYLKAKQLYQDSLNLHLRGLETLNFGRKFPGATNATLNQIEDIMDEKYPVSPDSDAFGKNKIAAIDMPKIGKGSAERGVPQYKKPVTIPEYKPTPVSVEQPKPTPAPVPVPTEPSTKYAYMPTNWGPTYYYEWDAQQKKWIPISQQSYNYNTEGGTKNTQLYSSTPPGFQYGGDPSIPELTQAKKGGWLNKYSKLPKKTSSKNIKSSINKLMIKNPLFQRNYMLYGAKGPRLYDPKSKYQFGGWLDTYQTGGKVVSEIWQEVTGTPWKKARELGLTDGSFEKNLELRARLLNGEFNNVVVNKQENYENKKQSAIKKQEAAKIKATAPKFYSSEAEYRAHLLDPWSPEKQAAQLAWINKNKSGTPKTLPKKPDAKKEAAAKQNPVKKPSTVQGQQKLLWNPEVLGNKTLSGEPIINDSRQVPQTGVVVDKRTNQVYYFGDQNQQGTFPVLTGKNVDLNYNPYSVEYLDVNPELRNTPRGYYIMETPSIDDPNVKNVPLLNDKGEVIGNYYDYLTNTYGGKYRPITPIPAYGMSAPIEKDLALHRTPGNPDDPEFIRRSKLYAGDANMRCTSYGCVNTQDASYDEIYKAFPTADTLLVLDSRIPEDARILKIAQSRINQKKQGGWLDSYQDGGVTINSEEEYKKSLLMKNKTKERMDAERAWVAKKVAAQNKAKVQQTSGLPSSQQQAAMFGIKPVAAESTGIAAKPVYTPKEKEDIQKAQYQAKREKAREKVRATYGPQGSNPRALYDEEGLINSYLGAQERQQKKEQEMKFLGTGLLAGAVAGPAVLGAMGSGIAAAPAYIRGAASVLDNPILGQSWLTPNTIMKGTSMASGAYGFKDETAPLAKVAYNDPTFENITNSILSGLSNTISVIPAVSTYVSKPFTKYITPVSSMATAEAMAANRLEKFIASKTASQVKSETKDLLKAGFEPEEPTQEYIYPVTPRRGLYSDNPYYPAIPESTGTAPVYYAQNLIAAPESTGIALQPNWLNNYR